MQQYFSAKIDTVIVNVIYILNEEHCKSISILYLKAFEF